jgi:hypothetical protein
VLGSKIVNFSLTTKAISSPKEKGTYRWRASAIPYSPGTGLANSKGVVEVQSLVPLPLELSLNAKVAPSRAGFSRVSLSGKLMAAGSGIPGIFLTLERGTTPRKLKRLGVISTNRGGEFGAAGDFAQASRPQRFFVHVTTSDIAKDLGLAGCEATTTTVPCIDATLPYNVSSRVLAVTIPAKR